MHALLPVITIIAALLYTGTGSSAQAGGLNHYQVPPRTIPLPPVKELPRKLPPPLTVETPPLTIPGEIVAVLQQDAARCTALDGTFSLDTNHLTRLDLNNDGHEDYILSSKGYICTDRRGTFRGTRGEEYYFFVSSGRNHALELFNDNIRAFDMRVTNLHPRYPVIVFATPCERGPRILRNYGETHMRWRGNRMGIVARNIGCHPVTAPTGGRTPPILQKPEHNAPELTVPDLQAPDLVPLSPPQ